MSSREHYRMQLNNIAAQQRRTVSYQESTRGSQHDPVWLIVVYVNNIEFGRAEGRNRNAAKEEAARQAINLIAQGY